MPTFVAWRDARDAVWQTATILTQLRGGPPQGYATNLVRAAEAVGHPALVALLFTTNHSCAHLRAPWVSNLRYFQYTGGGGRARLRDVCESYLRGRRRPEEHGKWLKALHQFGPPDVDQVNAMDEHTCDNTAVYGHWFENQARVTAVVLDGLTACGADWVSDLDWRDPHFGNSTALHRAAYDGNSALVALLLARGANPNAVDSSGATPLHVAKSASYHNISRLLDAHVNKAGRDAKDAFGRTAVQVEDRATAHWSGPGGGPEEGWSPAQRPALASPHAWPPTEHLVPDTMFGSLPATGCHFDVVDAAADDAFFLPYLAARQPVLLRGLAAQQPAFAKWSPQHLASASMYGNRTFALSTIPYAETFGAASGRESTIADFVAKLDGDRAGDREYLFTSDDVKPGDETGPDFDQTPSFMRGMLAVSVVQLALGPANSGAPFHHHKHAINSLFAGRKLWIVYPPGEGVVSNQHPLDFVHGYLGLAGTLNFTQTRNPPAICVQEAGDALFIPDGYAHATINLETSMGIAVEYLPVQHKAASTALDPRKQAWHILRGALERAACRAEGGSCAGDGEAPRPPNLCSARCEREFIGGCIAERGPQEFHVCVEELKNHIGQLAKACTEGCTPTSLMLAAGNGGPDTKDAPPIEKDEL